MYPNQQVPVEIQNFFFKKRVVVTGASSGIGQALAYWYLNQGAHVFLVAQDEEILKYMAR